MGLDKIAEYKKILGITTEELSDRSGIPVGTLNKILSGATKDPKLETLKAISRVLGLSLNDFDDRPGLRSTLSPDEAGLLDDYQKLNALGKKKAREDLADLTEIPKYVTDYPDTIAAHFDGEEMTDQQKAAIAKLRDIVKQQEN